MFIHIVDGHRRVAEKISHSESLTKQGGHADLRSPTARQSVPGTAPVLYGAAQSVVQRIQDGKDVLFHSVSPPNAFFHV